MIYRSFCFQEADCKNRLGEGLVLFMDVIFEHRLLRGIMCCN